MSNALSIFNQLRPVTVGYDNIFDHFEKMFEDDFFKTPSVNYPPYNIVKLVKINTMLKWLWQVIIRRISQ